MTKTYKIVVILDNNLGKRIVDLITSHYCWVLTSPDNNKYIEMATGLLEPESDPLETGITLLDDNFLNQEDFFSELIEEILEHHGPYTHDPGVNQIEFIGLSLEQNHRDILTEERFSEIETTENGFIAKLVGSQWEGWI